MLDPDELESAGLDTENPAPQDALSGEVSGDQVEAQMTASQKAQQLLDQRQSVAKGLQAAGSDTQGAKKVAVQAPKDIKPTVTLHPQTVQDFSSWFNQFKKTGGMM